MQGQIDSQNLSETKATREPSFLGTKELIDFPISDLRKYIDWTPFFSTWELAGRYPQILEDKVVGSEAKKLFADAQDMLDLIIKENWLKANGVLGFWPAHSVGDDIKLFEGKDKKSCLATLHTLRQQGEKAKEISNLHWLISFKMNQDPTTTLAFLQ